MSISLTNFSSLQWITGSTTKWGGQLKKRIGQGYHATIGTVGMDKALPILKKRRSSARNAILN